MKTKQNEANFAQRPTRFTYRVAQKSHYSGSIIKSY